MTNFREVRTDQPGEILRHGYPVDALPVDHTDIGQLCAGRKQIKLRSYLDCCAVNFMGPADKAARSFDVTAIIRGQRADESHKSPVKSGYVWDGVEYVFPIQDWSAADVVNFLRDEGIEITDRLQMTHSSLDCMNCTAYLKDSGPRFAYMRKHHPGAYADVLGLLSEIRGALMPEIAAIDSLLEGAQ